MQEQLISFKTAKLAKEKEFIYYTQFSYWEGKLTHITPGWEEEEGRIERYVIYPRYYAPTQSLLQKWLRDKHNLILQVNYIYECDFTPYTFFIYREGDSTPLNKWEYDFHTYEEALEIGLQETLKLI